MFIFGRKKVPSSKNKKTTKKHKNMWKVDNFHTYIKVVEVKKECLGTVCYISWTFDIKKRTKPKYKQKKLRTNYNLDSLLWSSAVISPVSASFSCFPRILFEMRQQRWKWKVSVMCCQKYWYMYSHRSWFFEKSSRNCDI